MDNDDLKDMLRSIIQEELKPVRDEMQQFRQEITTEMQQFRREITSDVQQFRQEINSDMQQFHGELLRVNNRLDNLEIGQKLLEQNQRKMQKDISTIKTEVRAMWEDIKRLDTRLIVQEQRNVR